ncbi:MAG: NADP-dependent malic enzyme [Deltaproteobacteria bacterium]|nr:NADP-dependent malic enzyme [Deltaproteobacteria bacterium]
MIRKEDALDYHERGRRGKIAVVPTKPLETQRDLGLAYSPGVAEPSRAIHEDPSLVGRYTIRDNLVAVITNGTAVLGLGNIGPLAAKPVMEGKAVLFKKYADIDVFDIEVDAEDPERFMDVVAALEPTFGGINLEDIKAPDCFRIEAELKKRMNIPVFHDDQHGTAIISGAALVNAAELVGKQLPDMKVVCIGAGAAALGCMHLWLLMGIQKDNITLIDRHGVVRQDREKIEPQRAFFARPASDDRHTLADAMKNADVMLGLSGPGLVTAEMLKTMADRPLVFPLANPDPEIDFNEAREARPDAIVGTGRSDYPNQINNVLGFPYIFRGALDVGASEINDEMQLAAARSLAELAREGVPEDVQDAYGGQALKFGPDYIIPKPMDDRALYWVAPAVAKAAMESGVASKQLDIDAYREELNRKLSPTRQVMWKITALSKKAPARILYPEGEEAKILHAADIVAHEGIARPTLIGRPEVIASRAKELGLDLEGVEVIDRDVLPDIDAYADMLWHRRQRHGLTRERARAQMTRSRTTYAMMMLAEGATDGVVAGLTTPYPDTIRPALEIIGTRRGVRRASGTYMAIAPTGVKFLADTTLNIDPDAETLAETALLTAELVRELGITPRVAMLSFSNFGDAPHPASRKVAAATRMVKERDPELEIDGEMQADVALLDERRALYPFSTLTKPANVLIFPNLGAGNIAYKLLRAAGDAEIIGPLVLGMRRAVNVLQQEASVSTIVHMTAITSARARRLEQRGLEPIG